MQADYQLRHNLFGRTGSFWERQVDQTTKDRMRLLCGLAGSAEQLQRLDVTAAYAAGLGSVLVEGVSFDFIDGNFAHVGSDFEAYTRFDSVVTGEIYARRDPANVGRSASDTPRAHALSDLEDDFLASLGTFGVTSDWFLIPVPAGMSPILIESKLPGVTLVAGVDFTAHPGYIALRDSPGEVFNAGRVSVQLAIQQVDQPNSFVLESPLPRRGNSRIAEYAKNTQSVAAFRRAAAEYCGLFVLPCDDLVLSSRIVGGATIYVFATSGAVTIDYPHDALLAGHAYRSGHVVSGRFQFLTASDGYGTVNDAGGTTQQEVSLDGVLPIKGLSWTAGTSVSLSSTESGPDGRLHAKMALTGSAEANGALAHLQKAQELATGVFLSDAFPKPASGPWTVDFGDILEQFYQGRYVLVVVDQLVDATSHANLLRFLSDSRPVTCALLLIVVPDILSA